jgi:phosphatidylserine/phosphatidylglycerophosphate/cardiolipin synthase-like enzyme
VSRRDWLLVGLAAVALAVLVATAVALARRGRERAVPQPPPPATVGYEVLFTTPQRTGTPPPGSAGRLDERLVQLLDGASRTVDMAVYDIGLLNVADALVRAKERGVRVRIVTDTDNAANPAVERLRAAGIPVVDDKRGALMHHKFVVIDDETVVTGAWNVAERDTFRHNNNTVVFRSPLLARNFTNEFNKMFERRSFGPTKPKDVPNPVVEVGGARVETWFASEQDLVPVIVRRLQSARSSIAFMTFSFTLDDLAAVLEERARNGVSVWGVFETTGSETRFSEYKRLTSLKPAAAGPPFSGCPSGPAVVQDGNPFLMHHKVFVIDERTVLFGSFNYTANAAEDNDEALLIVDDPAMARLFLEEFCRVYKAGVEKSKR